MTIKEINERASNKAFAQITMLQLDIKDIENDIKNNNTSIVPLERLEKMIKSTKAEIEVWDYIAKLIEIDNINVTNKI